MKYIVISITVLICIVPFSVFAQNGATDAGGLVFDIGSIVDFTIYTGDAYKGDNQVTEINIGSGLTYLNCSYFVIDNLAVGGEIFFNSVKVKGNDDPDTMFVIEPMVSYYTPLMDKLYFRTSVGIMFISIQFAGFTDSITQFGFGFGGGVIYLLTPNLGIYGGVTYATALEAEYDGETLPDSAFDYIDIDIGLSIFL
jgi:hypothetical protein